MNTNKNIKECIVLQDVEYTYPTGIKVKIDEFKVEEFERVFISGKTGSGKSTLLRIINGLIPKMYGGKLKGYINVYGRGGNNEDVFLVTQHPEEQVLMDTVLDELIFTAIQHEKTKSNVNQKVDEFLSLSNKVGLKIDLHKNMQKLSEGEKQFVIFCCALISKCKCLAFDEPFAHLHPNVVSRLLRLLKVDRTIVLSDHRVEFSKEFDRIIRLDSCNREKIKKIIEEIKEIKDEKSKCENYKVKLNGSVLRGKREILNDVKLEVNSGEVVALTGINGSGKTTLLRCIAGFEKFVGKLEVKGSIGFSFHYPAYSFSKSRVKDEADEYYLRAFDLSKVAERHPHSLSGGEKRLLSIAKAMKREIVLLDEPTAGLDRLKRLKLLRNVMKEAKSKCKAVIIATHDFEIASLCDRCIECEKWSESKGRE